MFAVRAGGGCENRQLPAACAGVLLGQVSAVGWQDISVVDAACLSNDDPASDDILCGGGDNHND